MKMVPEIDYPFVQARAPARSTSGVTSVLRERIRSGRYRSGEWLPTERVLTEDLRVHRRIVRQAIDQLVHEGFLSRQPHCRPVIADAIPTEATTSAPITAISPLAPSRFVALVMWQGGTLEQGGTAQQRIFWGMNQALGQAGYHALFLNLGDQIGSVQENAEREAAHLRYVLEQKMGGVIFYPYAYEENRELIRDLSRQMPLCLIDRMVPGVQADYVGMNNRQGMRDATAHLIEQGHRRIAYITKAEPINSVQDRLLGYMDAMQAAFHDSADQCVLTAPTYKSGAWSLFDLVFSQAEDKRPTAALAFNDYEAEWVARRLATLGLQVPRDVALVGFDSIVQTLPNGVGLTSVAQPFEDLGRTAAQTLVKRIESPSAPPAYVELPTTLIVRKSTASTPGSL